MKLEDLEIYTLAREIGRTAWKIYSAMTWQQRKVIGDQFVSAVDSVGANIAEGRGRFHFLDKNKFNYNARGSLFEGIHWLGVLFERKMISENAYLDFRKQLDILHFKLNNYINLTKGQVAKGKIKTR
ncbi:MAG: four helix bundle protein [Candidatus Liptonbacteria bacterium]|nr:four helix bundle protein [Candidatus Liptonbacteria bacterium]